MPIIKYIVNNSSASVDTSLNVGQSLMEGAISQRVPGILAECGGACMCATCHIYIEDGPTTSLPPMSDDEDAMLSETLGERLPTSRLACQIRVTQAMDGLVVRVADNR